MDESLDLDGRLGGEDRPLTSAERAFLVRLFEGRQPDLDVWRHSDADGTPWTLVSRDFVAGNAVRDTLRLDFDGNSIAGGWSPAFLNWDDGVRAADAQIVADPPDGIRLSGSAPTDLADAARVWFDGHIARWLGGARAARWTR
jgi:hypothetical protein